MDRHGWPVTLDYAGSGAGRPLAALRAVPLLVLRAEWGMGKSFAFAQETDELKSGGVPAKPLDLGECGTVAARVGEKLSKAFEPPVDQPGEWHVLLDGLDEGMDNLADLPELIVEQIEALAPQARGSLRLRISCRTARWPLGFEADLDRLWPGEGECETVTLVPLSREDVSMAVDRAAVGDAVAFTALIENLGLVPLATNPMTLRQLLENFKGSQSLPATAREAYRQACLRLCTETRRPRQSERLRTQAAPEHLFAVATRVAAVLQFSGHAVVSDIDAQEGEPAGDAVALSQLESGTEPGHLGHEVPCTMAQLRQLTESSLLTPVGDYSWQFTHQSYREFLASEFLLAHRVPQVVQRELLWIGDGPGRHVIAAHQEVAAWLSGSDREVFEDLLKDDPVVALLCRDLPSRPDDDRGRLVDALLGLLERDDSARLDYASLHRLDHPQLPGQLRPFLTAGAAQDWLVYWAARIAGGGRRRELVGDLLDIAESTAHSLETRVAALRAVGTPGGQDVQRLLVLTQDDSAEVVAAALQRLRPDHLSLFGFLSLFREPEPLYVGVAWALRREVPQQITAAEVGEAVQWADQVLQHPGARGSQSLALSVLARAVALTDQGAQLDDVVPYVANALLGAACDRDLLWANESRQPLKELGRALAAAQAARRALVLRLLTSGRTSHTRTLFANMPNGSLCRPEDLPYWMEHWGQLREVDHQLSALLLAFPRPLDSEALRRCEAARAADRALAQATASWDAVPAEAPHEQGRRRKSVERNRLRNTYSETRLRAAVDAVLAAAGDTVRTRWGEVLLELLRTPDGKSYISAGSLMTLVTDAPSCPPSGTALARKLQQAALHLLREAPVLRAEDLAPHGMLEFRQAPELTSFTLFGSFADMSVDPDRWAGWAAALACTPTGRADALEVQHRFLVQCDQRAADSLPPLLTAFLDAASAEGARTLARSYARLADAGTRGVAVLREWADRPGIAPEQWQAVLGELAIGGDEQALDAVAEVLRKGPGTLEGDSPGTGSWMRAAEILLQCERLPEFWPAIHSGLGEEAVLEDFLARVARMPALEGYWPGPVGRLPEQDLADLFRLLVRHLGPAAAAGPVLRSGFLSEQDQIREMVQSLPNILATRATTQAARELQALSEEYPQGRQLRHQARTTARASAASAAVPLTPHDLLQLAAHSYLRVVRDESQLLGVVIEALQAYQEELQGSNGTAVNLWNRDQAPFQADTKCWPAWEDDLSDAVTAFLRREIGGNRAVVNRKVVVNREVETRRTGLPGLRTDIHIDVPVSEDGEQDSLRVIIECKGCWSDELSTALERQLTAYLTGPRTAGLFLVGYFNCTRWNHKTDRGCPAKNHDIDRVRGDQCDAAVRVRARTRMTVSSFVLDCTLPGAESDWRKQPPEPS